ncbi:MAG: phosphatidate cytidylyltransferase [Pseudomonadota bacterium]|nr:phosphatidate cytidylyltransferase [Pseudomonadota bacterium]
MSPLKKRILSGVVIVPIVIALVLLLPFTAFWVASWMVMGLVAWEWLPLAGYHTFWGRLLGVILIVALGMLISIAGMMNDQRTVLWLALLIWLLLTPLVLTFPITQPVWGKSPLMRAVMAMLVIIPCGCALTVAADMAWRVHLLFGLILIWGADITAYFAGHKWGHAKLLPLVSPGKTIAGFAGAIVTGLVLSIIFWLIQTEGWIDDGAKIAQFMVIGVMTVLAAVIGDLFESMLKRNAGVKDSSNLIPGHGGILDRLDSMLAALPLFILLNLL